MNNLLLFAKFFLTCGSRRLLIQPLAVAHNRAKGTQRNIVMTVVTERQLTVCTLLQHAKKRVGFTLASLAKHVGVCEVTAETWLTGRYLPSAKYHAAICEHTRTHRTRFTRIYDRQMEERRDNKRTETPYVDEVPCVEVPKQKQEAPPTEVKETTSQKWAIELALEVSKFDKAMFRLFMDVLDSANKELHNVKGKK